MTSILYDLRTYEKFTKLHETEQKSSRTTYEVSQVNYNVGPEDLSKVCANTTGKPSWNMQGSVTDANWNTLIPTYSMDDLQGAAISVTTTCEYIGDTEDQIDSVYTYVELNKGIPKNPWNFRGLLNCSGKDECTLQKLTVKVKNSSAKALG